MEMEIVDEVPSRRGQAAQLMEKARDHPDQWVRYGPLTRRDAEKLRTPIRYTNPLGHQYDVILRRISTDPGIDSKEQEVYMYVAWLGEPF